MPTGLAGARRDIGTRSKQGVRSLSANYAHTGNSRELGGPSKHLSQTVPTDAVLSPRMADTIFTATVRAINVCKRFLLLGKKRVYKRLLFL